MKRRGSAQAGSESNSIWPERSYGLEEVSLIVFSTLYNSVMFIVENWRLSCIMGGEVRKKSFKEDEHREEGREVMKWLFKDCGSRRELGIVGEELLWPPRTRRFFQKS